MSITVACVWVKGYVQYSRDYVLRLHSMVTKYADRDFRFVCLTDQPDEFAGTWVEAIGVPTPVGVLPWWSKLSLFNPTIDALQSGRCLYLDLDTVVLRPLAPIMDFPSAFALVPDASQFPGKGARKTVHRFNSSVMVWDGGTQNELFTEFRPAVTRRLWGDQDWIGERALDATAMPLEWFPRLSECREQRPSEEAAVLLCKKPKNEEAARLYPWFKEAWV